MAQTESTPFIYKQIEKRIKQGAKKVIASSDINSSTRSGTKELEHLIKRLAQHPFSSLKAASDYGEALGQAIVERSHQFGKTNLDRNVIWQMVVQNDFPPLPDPTNVAEVAPVAPPQKSTLPPVESNATASTPPAPASVEPGEPEAPELMATPALAEKSVGEEPVIEEMSDEEAEELDDEDTEAAIDEDENPEADGENIATEDVAADAAVVTTDDETEVPEAIETEEPVEVLVVESLEEPELAEAVEASSEEDEEDEEDGEEIDAEEEVAAT